MSSSKTEAEKKAGAGHEWHALSVSDVLKALSTSAEGLSMGEVKNRLEKYGRNEFTQTKQVSLLGKIFAQFKSPLTTVLLVAFFVTIALSDYLDAGVILFALLIAVILGVFQEGKASRAFEKLADSQVHLATVLREKKKHQIEASELVPGDVVYIQNGMQVPADIRIIESKQLAINEAPLTGEWLSVWKIEEDVPVGTPLAEQSSMAHMGTFVAKGYGTGVVVATGDNTSVGKLAEDLSSIEDEKTPLHSIQPASSLTQLQINGDGPHLSMLPPACPASSSATNGMTKLQRLCCQNKG